MSMVSMYLGGREVLFDRTADHSLVAFAKRNNACTYEVSQFGATLDSATSYHDAFQAAYKHTGPCIIYRIQPDGTKWAVHYKRKSVHCKKGSK